MVEVEGGEGVAEMDAYYFTGVGGGERVRWHWGHCPATRLGRAEQGRMRPNRDVGRWSRLTHTHTHTGFRQYHNEKWREAA